MSNALRRSVTCVRSHLPAWAVARHGFKADKQDSTGWSVVGAAVKGRGGISPLQAIEDGRKAALMVA